MFFQKETLTKFDMWTMWTPTLQNGQIHSNNSSAIAYELLEFDWLFCGVGI